MDPDCTLGSGILVPGPAEPTNASLGVSIESRAVIAVTKDLVDIEGDRKGGIDTFASRIGPAKVALGAGVVLLLNYAGAIATALLAAPGTFRRVFMASGHALASGWLLAALTSLQPERVESLKKYYKRIWDLFYLEYAMYPFI